MKAKTSFFCTDCGNETAKWSGQCPACGSWNTLVEQPKTGSGNKAQRGTARKRNVPKPFSDLNTDREVRFQTGLKELDRVLGGGAVKGSLVLIGGAPGIGKSTLLLQACGYIGTLGKILYITGEESERQIKMRGDRLNVSGIENIFVLSETNIANVIPAIEEIEPNVVIVDSIQTLYDEEMTSAPGSVGQVKACTMTLMQIAKSQDITIFVVGHVNKEGAIAGPKVLEHMVDCVLYFEGTQSNTHRILRAAKNRFGSTNEIGVFEMGEMGLTEVINPSEMLLSGRPEDSPGTCVTCVIEGTRPVLAEIQALLSPTGFNVPRRNSNGLEYNRAMLLLAVLEKRCGLKISGCDAYINVIGGLNIDEPAADLAAVIAIASSYKDKIVPGTLAALGEVGLTGEIRAVTQLGQRLSELARMGFRSCLIPGRHTFNEPAPENMTLIPVRTIDEALKYLTKI